MIRFVPVVLLFYAGSIAAQSPISYEAESKKLVRTLHDRHVQPLPTDDAFSRRIFDNVLLELDPDAIYFTAKDIQSLEEFKLGIDNELAGLSPWTFLPKLTALYKSSIERYRQGITDLSKVAIDANSQTLFTQDTTFESNPERLKAKWAFAVRSDIFNRLYGRSLKKRDQPEKEFFSQNEKVVREQVSRLMLRSVEKHLSKTSGVVDFVAVKFMNSIASSFDPHSHYFSPQKIKEFMASLSSRGAFYGFGLDENQDGEVFITNLKPGGAAWSSGQIFEGDVIEEIQFEAELPIEVLGYSVKDVVSILDESMKDAMKLVVRNAEGVSKEVWLRKQVGDAEDNVVRSFILNGKQKIGFISLPAFYSSWNDKDQGRCANDVAREVVRLKAQQVEGIILDIRYNGGGLMDEAVAMAGIFIDAGPMVAIKNQAGEVRTVKDMNRGTIYDGPLLVLINGASASASELLAAALQDYHRAVIVGSTTYGKGTAQQIFSIANTSGVAGKGTMRSVGSNAQGSGYVSITMERFYRVTGKTNQFVGVVPDITLPDILSKLPIGERFVPNAFKPDSVQKKIYYQSLSALPIDTLANMSRRRQQSNPGFAEIGKYGELILNLHRAGVTKSGWAEYRKARMEDLEMISKVKEKTLVQTSAFKIIPTPNSISTAPPNEYENAYNARWITRLEKDLQLGEGYSIMCDIINLFGKR